MLNGIFSSLSGLDFFSKRQANTANNLANINTTGFKRTGIGGRGTLSVGMLEAANVDAAQEMVDQIINSAAFKANITAIKTEDEMASTILDLKS